MLKKRMSRRNFIKAGAMTGVLMGSPGMLTKYSVFAETSAAAPVIIKSAMCNGCGNRCGMRVSVKNGRIWRAVGHSDCANSRGTLCGRGQAILTQPYVAHRIERPLKRVGENRFEPISWDQAFKEIGEKLKIITDTHGPGSVFYADHPKTTGRFFWGRFMDAIGAPTINSHNAACNLARNTGFYGAIGTVPGYGGSGIDWDNSNYVIVLGRSYGDGVNPRDVQLLVKASERGAKIIMLDPRYNNSCQFATEWLSIRPGTDLAFLLAMAHTIIKEDLHDKSFVNEYGHKFDEFAKGMTQYTPAWAEPITGIKADTIARIAREYAKAKPAACIETSWKGAFGSNYGNSTETARMVIFLNALIGNFNEKGGMKFGSKIPFGKLDQKNPPKPTIPRLDEINPGGKYALAYKSYGVTQLTITRASEGMTKAGFIQQHNPARTLSPKKEIVEGLKALELLVVVDHFVSETAELAHYILPQAVQLERREMVESKGSFVCINDQVVKPVKPETLPLEAIVGGIAKAYGVGEFFNFTIDELNKALLAPLGISYDDVIAKGYVKYNAPPKAADAPKFKLGGNGKVNFYSESYKENGYSPVPQWVAPLVEPNKNDPKEFRLIWGKQAMHSHTGTLNLPVLVQISLDNKLDLLWMHPQRAEALGIKNGDTVIVENERSKGKIQVKVTERMHPEAVFMPPHFGPFATRVYEAAKFGLNPNDYNTYREEMISGATCNQETLVKVYKA